MFLTFSEFCVCSAFSIAGRLLGLPRSRWRPVDEVWRYFATTQSVQSGHLTQPRRQQQRRRSVSSPVSQ